MSKRLARYEFVLLLIWPILASIFSLLVDAEVYVSLFLFFGVPSLYLSYRHPKLIKKNLFFSILFSVPMAFLLGYVMDITNGWVMGRMELPHIWVLQHVSLLLVIWPTLYTYFVIMYYEVFFDRSVRKVLYPRTKAFMFLGIAGLLLLCFLHFFDKDILFINYFYLKIGLLGALVPLILFLLKKPSLAAKFFKVGTYFFFYTLIYELIALRLSQWSFPAAHQFIGQVTLLGYTFPFEELFFWMIISAAATLAYYEYFDDDGV